MTGDWKKMGLLQALALSLALALVPPAGLDGRSLGKGNDPLLESFNAALDAQGLDIVPGLARELGFERVFRPRLARLGGYAAPESKRLTTAEGWTRHFARGAFNYLVAYRSEKAATARETPGEGGPFLAEWRAAPEANRVFIAFTREDVASAQKVEAVLRAKGFVVFTYLRGQGQAPWAHPDVVGRLFREAGHHYVIDTPNARRSGGVAFEALAFERLKQSTKRATPAIKGRGCRDMFLGSGT